MSKNDPQSRLSIAPGDGDVDPPIRPPRITSVSPIGGALAGGIDVTITGSGFRPEAEVFFGGSQSPEVHFVSTARVTAKLPPAAQTGSVDVRLVNPDGGSATRPGAFTYVTNAASLHAEVLGVEPLTVIEDTESEITIRGRNLIAAYNEGIVALRGSNRVQITFSGFSSSTDEASGIDSLTLTVRVTAAPPLEQHERNAVQVLASLRPGAATDGIFQTSRQMFTVLPRAVPVLLAFTANLDPGKPNLVMVAGRNLEGCSLDMGQGAVLHVQKSDDQTVAAVVSFPEDVPVPETANLKLLDAAGGEAGQFAMKVAPGVEPSAAKAAPADSAASAAAADPGDGPGDGGEVSLTLTPFPGQQILGPTATDSVIFPARGDSLSPFSFNFGAFHIRVFQRTLRIQLFNEVRLIPFFDNGVGDRLNNTPVLAQVGKLFRVRGMGLLVALHVELIIHIEIVLIIGFRFQVSPFGLFNEFFDDYPFAIGSLVISIRLAILIQIDFIIAFVVALVMPGGALKELFSFNLRLNIDFRIDSDGLFHFGTRFKHRVNFIRLGPILNNLLPCDGRFQLAEENGQTVFTDSFGGQVSFYMPRSAGRCCIPWDFGLELVRFEDGAPEQTVQGRFRAEFCLNAAESSNQNRAVVVSDRTPRGFPPPLQLDIQDTSNLKAMFRRVSADGIPVGDDLVDVREFGYQVEFYLSRPPDVVEAQSLRDGTAWALMAGENVILPRLFKVDVVIVETDEEAPSFWPGGVTGFDILGFLARGLMPAIRTDGGLPVQVRNPTEIAVAATLVFKDPTASTAAERDRLNEAPPYFTIPVSGNPPSPQETVLKLERCEPFEDRPLEYFLAAKITSLPPGVSFPVRLKLNVTGVRMMVFVGDQPHAGTPLEGTGYSDGRPSVGRAERFFSQLPPNQEVTVEFDALNKPRELFRITPNLKESGSASTRRLVPPGEGVANRKVVLEAKLTAADASSANTPVTQPKPLKLAVHNDENYEEYRRVFTEVQDLFNGSNTKVITYRDFAGTFFRELVAAGAAPSDATLGQKGVALWNHAVSAVQASVVQGTQTPDPVVTLDDRLLYWTRLRAIGALKAYYARKQGRTLDETTLSRFEWPSRGLEQSGSIGFPAAARKAIVTGFDPFELDDFIHKTNPSGLSALWLNGKTITSTQGNTFVRTAIFPVRYKEFDESLVEKAVRSNLGSIALLMTVSQGWAGIYAVDRFASKKRGGGLDNNNRGLANNNISLVPLGFLTTPGPNPDGPEFIESSLPYERVITHVIDTRHLPEPQRGPTFTSNDGFIVNQSYTGTQTSHPMTFNVQADETWKKHPDQPLPYVDATNKGEESVVGSGGDYLSNEIFYRTARVRLSDRPALPSGHLHIPPLGTNGDQPSLGPGLVTAVERALQKFLNDKLQLRSLGDVAFPDTVINQPSAQLLLKAQNETTDPVDVVEVDVDEPTIFVSQTALPVRVPPRGVLELSFIFKPTATTTYKSIARVKEAAGPSGKILFSAQLRGKGLAVPPPPVIVRFEPAGGEIGDPVTIFGSNLANAAEVRIGGGLIMVVSNTDTQIEAMVTMTARTGAVSVRTVSGTATTTDRFTVIRHPHHVPVSAQLIARRAELGLSASEAAAEVGARPGTYRRWESGEDRPSARFRPGIAGFLGHNPNPDPETFGEIIRAVRERDGLTRSQLAERLGLASSTIKAWEDGAVRRPSTRVSSIFEAYVAEE